MVIDGCNNVLIRQLPLIAWEVENPIRQVFNNGHMLVMGILLALEIIGPCANSLTHCYVAGGGETPRTKNIDQMSFASGGTCHDAGDLSNNNQFGSGSSSKAGFAYVAGGNTSSGVTDDIEQYAMVSSTTASDVGHLVAPRSGANMANMNGHQY